MPRFYDPSYVFEVARRTNRGEDLFDANDPDQVSSIVGILAEGQQRYGVQIFHIHFMSNHYHGLFRARTPLQLARFLNFLHGEIAKKINRNRQHPGAVWSSKFTPLAVTLDAKTLLSRMKYLTGQALRARLVTHPSQFPGVSAVDWLLFGVPLVGRYGNKTPGQASEATPDGDPGAREVVIAKLPCFEERSWTELHAMYAALADELAGWPAGPLGAEAPPPQVVAGEGAPGVNREHNRGQAADGAGTGQVQAADWPAGGNPEGDPEGASSEITATTEHFGEAAAVRSRAPSTAGKVHVQIGRNEDDGAPLVRGPVQPKGESSKKRRGKLRILTFSAVARSRYLDDVSEFFSGYARAMAKLRRNIDFSPGGVRLRGRVAFPRHALLPGCLAPM